MAITTSIRTPEDAVNDALVRIGHPLRIGAMTEGSAAAKKALDVYGQTRDATLRTGDWGFAQRDVSLTLLKQAPPSGYLPPNQWDPKTNPPLGYVYEYAYPVDCLKIRALKQAPVFMPNFTPVPAPYRVQNDNYFAPPQKVILCNIGGALLTYTGRVTDPTTWEPAFAEALCTELARRLTVALANPQLLQSEAADEVAEVAKAEPVQG